jgi:glutathione S-transferase
MLTLYGHPSSPNSRKVHWALEEIGVPYEYKRVELMKREQKLPDYVKLNPNGRVPTLIDDGFTLYESNAIMWYLADKFGGGKLAPDHVQARALVDQWVYWQTSDLGPAAGRPYRMKIYASVGQPFDQVQFDAALEAIKAPLALLDAHLQGRAFVVGDDLSIADIALAESVGLARQLGADVDAFPHVSAWFARLAERPAFQKTRAPKV